MKWVGGAHQRTEVCAAGDAHLACESGRGGERENFGERGQVHRCGNGGDFSGLKCDYILVVFHNLGFRAITAACVIAYRHSLLPHSQEQIFKT